MNILEFSQNVLTDIVRASGIDFSTVTLNPIHEQTTEELVGALFTYVSPVEYENKRLSISITNDGYVTLPIQKELLDKVKPINIIEFEAQWMVYFSRHPNTKLSLYVMLLCKKLLRMGYELKPIDWEYLAAQMGVAETVKSLEKITFPILHLYSEKESRVILINIEPYILNVISNVNGKDVTLNEDNPTPIH